MREVKFRGYCEKDSEWRYGFYITDGKVHEINTMLKSGEFYASQVDAESVSQYIGLKDKNGVEIYDGDILRYVNKVKIETLTAPVEYIEDRFHVREGDDCWHSIGGICSDENHEGSHVGFVIGNIYENPELLK